jgi:hypothetical protein
VNSKPEIRIDARAQASTDLLRLDCTFVNQSDRPLYVFTRVLSKSLQPLPQRAYTAYRADDEALHVFLGVPPIPKGLHVYAKVVPLASLVRPGKSVMEHFELPVPVAEWQPYADPETTDDVEPVQTHKVVVTTEYFSGDKLVREPRWDAALGYFRALGVPLLRTHMAIELAAPIVVMKRNDEFPRF